MKYKKVRDRQSEGKDKTKWKNMTKGGKICQFNLHYMGMILTMISMPAVFRFISHWYVYIKATNSKQENQILKSRINKHAPT